MKQKLSNALIVALAALSTPALAAAADPAPAEKPGVSQPSDLSPPVAQAMVDDVNIGVSVASNGRVPAGAVDDFLPGEDIFVTMDVSDAAPGTIVKVVWVGPGDMRIAEQHQTVAAGAGTLKFVKNNTRDWKPGDYRAEIWVGDEKVNDEKFNIVSNRNARN